MTLLAPYLAAVCAIASTLSPITTTTHCAPRLRAISNPALIATSVDLGKCSCIYSAKTKTSPMSITSRIMLQAVARAATAPDRRRAKISDELGLVVQELDQLLDRSNLASRLPLGRRL